MTKHDEQMARPQKNKKRNLSIFWATAALVGVAGVLFAISGALSQPAPGSDAPSDPSAPPLEASLDTVEAESKGQKNQTGTQLQLSQELRNKLRSEFYRNRIATVQEQAAGAEEKEQAEQEQAMRSAHALIAQATNDGLWTEQDAISLVGLHEKMSRPQISETMSQMRELFASGKLDYERTGPH